MDHGDIIDDERPTGLQRFGRAVGRIAWDSDVKSPAERRFMRKLDGALMTIACLGYFVKVSGKLQRIKLIRSTYLRRTSRGSIATLG